MIGWLRVSIENYSLSLDASSGLLDKNHSLGFAVFGPLGGGSGIKRGMAPSITCIGMITYMMVMVVTMVVI